MKTKIAQKVTILAGGILLVALLGCENDIVLTDKGKQVLSGVVRDMAENSATIPYQAIGESIVNLWGIGNLMCGATTDAGRATPYNIIVNYSMEERGSGYTIPVSDALYSGLVHLMPTNSDAANLQLRARTIQSKRFDTACQAESGGILVSDNGRIIHEFQNLQPEDPRLGLTIHEVGHCLGLAHPSKVDEGAGKTNYYRVNNPAWIATGGESGGSGDNAYRPVMDGLLLGNVNPSSWEKEAVQALFSKDGVSTSSATFQRHNQIREFLRATIVNANTIRTHNGATNIFCTGTAGSGRCEGYSQRWRLVEGIAVSDGLLSQNGILVELRRNNQQEGLYLDSLFSSGTEAGTKSALGSTGALNTQSLGDRSVAETHCIDLYIITTPFLETEGNTK